MEVILNIFATIFLLGLIVLACEIFTNAIENLGCTLKLSANATGSVFAAIGTALPETVVPLVAIIGGIIKGDNIKSTTDIGLGAILGSSFLISTLAMCLAGFAVIIFINKRKNSFNISTSSTSYLRDLKYFVIAYMIAIFTSFIPYDSFKIAIGSFLILYYILYATRTILKGNSVENIEESDELIFCQLCKIKTSIFFVIIQLILSLILLIFASHFFVSKISYFANILKISPLILSLLITPYATELPEITNSVLWIKQGKDSLAISNLSGALVFQGTIPVAIGIILTPWKFDYSAIVNITLVLTAVMILYYRTRLLNKISHKTLIFSGIFYILFILIILFDKMLPLFL